MKNTDKTHPTTSTSLPFDWREQAHVRYQLAWEDGCIFAVPSECGNSPSMLPCGRCARCAIHLWGIDRLCEDADSHNGQEFFRDCS